MRKICCSLKIAADALVDLRRGRAVVTERLLEHDARGRRDQRLLRQRLRRSARTGPAPVERKNARTLLVAAAQQLTRAARSHRRRCVDLAVARGARRIAPSFLIELACRGASGSWPAPAPDTPRATARCAPTPMMRDSPSSCPAQQRRYSAGSSLRMARSPVPPKRTRSKVGKRLHEDTLACDRARNYTPLP